MAKTAEEIFVAFRQIFARFTKTFAGFRESLASFAENFGGFTKELRRILPNDNVQKKSSQGFCKSSQAFGKTSEDFCKSCEPFWKTCEDVCKSCEDLPEPCEDFSKTSEDFPKTSEDFDGVSVFRRHPCTSSPQSLTVYAENPVLRALPPVKAGGNSENDRMRHGLCRGRALAIAEPFMAGTRPPKPPRVPAGTKGGAWPTFRPCGAGSACLGGFPALKRWAMPMKSLASIGPILLNQKFGTMFDNLFVLVCSRDLLKPFQNYRAADRPQLQCQERQDVCTFVGMFDARPWNPASLWAPFPPCDP
jgi:hypothetical protein